MSMKYLSLFIHMTDGVEFALICSINSISFDLSTIFNIYYTNNLNIYFTLARTLSLYINGTTSTEAESTEAYPIDWVS